MNLDIIELKIYWIRTLFITMYTFITFIKVINYNNLNKKFITLSGIFTFLISIITSIIKYNAGSFMAIVSLIFLIGLMSSKITKNNVGYSILVSVISLSFNCILFVMAVIISYIINKFYVIKNDFINLGVIELIHFIFLCKMLKTRKLKYGISFLNKNVQDDYFDVIILNISVSILFSFIIFANRNFFISKNLFIGFLVFVIIMIITIHKSLQLYYKHKLLVKDMEEAKLELLNKNQEIEALEQENLNFSKKSHSLAHKQKALEYKLNQLMLNSETAEELEVKRNLENISKELYVNQVTVELSKTDIPEIDNMLSFMQSECRNNNIDFDLQIIGNIYYMINNLISKEELEILLADHIKDAIIAINHTDSINKSILVKLGQIDDCYGIYIYDSGIEFEKETLENLGKKPSTTHRDEGGTGMGFMNTFDTLRKHKASLIINEIGKPSKDNYTKVLMFKFDGKDEFKVISYKEN